MGLGLEDASVVLDGNEFQAHKIAETNQHLFSARVTVLGEFVFGVVPVGEEVKINLAENGITTPVIIESIIALTSSGTADELIFALYRRVGDEDFLIGKQKFSNGQVPKDHPVGVVSPDMTIGVTPTKSDSLIVVYVNPAKVLFRAVPNPVIVSDGDSGDSTGNSGDSV